MAKTDVASSSNEDALKGVLKTFGIDTAGKSIADIAYGYVSENVATSFSPKVERLGCDLAKSSGIAKTQEKAEIYGKRAGFAFRTVLPMGMTIYKSSKDIRKTVSSYTGLSSTYATALKASGVKNYGFLTGMNSDLEVVKNERSSLSNKAKNDMKGMGVSLLLDIPSMISTHVSHAIGAMSDLQADKKRKKKRKKKNKEEDGLGELMSDQYRAMAEKTAGAMDNLIDKFENKDGSYNKLVDNFVRGVNRPSGRSWGKGKGLEEIRNDPDEKIKFLETVNQTVLGDMVKSGARGLRPWLTEKFNTRSDKAFNKPTAGKMIIALQDHMKKNPSPVGISLPGCSKKECSLEEYIVDIFVQHQNDSGRAEPGRQALGQIHQAAAQIAEAMADPHRRLDPQALVLLVDRKHGIGTYTKGDLVAVKYGEELDIHLAELQDKKGMSLRKRRVPAAKVFKEYEATKQDFTDTWKELTDEEKFLWSTFLPKEVLLEIGVSKEDERSMRHQENELWQEVMESFLSAMKQYSPTELEELGLNEVQIGTLAEAVKQTGKRSGNYLQRNRHEVTRLTADISTIIASRGEEKDFIKDILAEAAEKREKRTAAMERKKNKSLAEVVSDRDSEPNENSRG